MFIDSPFKEIQNVEVNEGDLEATIKNTIQGPKAGLWNIKARLFPEDENNCFDNESSSEEEPIEFLDKVKNFKLRFRLELKH